MLKHYMRVALRNIFKNRTLSLIVACCFLFVSVTGAQSSPDAHLRANLSRFPEMFKDGKTQPIFSNDADRVVVEEVWVESPLDTDFDGKRDLLRLSIRRPVETLPERGGLKVPVIASVTPYSGTQGRPIFSPFFGRVDGGFVNQGAAATRFQHTRYPDGQQIVGAEGDMSYQAIRNITNQRIGVGANATVARHRELLAHGMMKRTADQYTQWHRDNFPWLPPARTPQGKQRDGAPWVNPGNPDETFVQGGWSTRFIPLGYAVCNFEIIGSTFGEGILQYGSYVENLAAAAMVDWLNGRVRAYTCPEGKTEVEAYWTTGTVAMSGASYLGTLPIAAAVTGVEGLRTILPMVPVTNAYDYYRANSAVYAPGGWQGEEVTSIILFCFGRGFQAIDARTPRSPVFPNQATWKHFWGSMAYHLKEQDTEKGDYSPYWDERNIVSFGDDMRKDVGVMMFHGFNDDNVKFKNTALVNEMLKYYGISVVKGIFTQSGHSGAWEQDGAKFAENMHEWMDHFLYGVNNGVVKKLPNYNIQSNVDLSWKEYDRWPVGVYRNFYPSGSGRVGTISTTAPAAVHRLTFKDEILFNLIRPVTHNEAIYLGRDAYLKKYPGATWAPPNSAIPDNWAGIPHFVPDYLENANLHAGHGQVMSNAQYDRWRNWLIGGVDNTAAWSGGSGRWSAPNSLTNEYNFTKAINDRVMYIMDVKEDMTINGTIKMTAEIAASKDVGVISAMLVDIGCAQRFSTSSSASGNTAPAPNGGTLNLQRFTRDTITSPARIISRGSVDVRNPNPDGKLWFELPGMKQDVLPYGGNWHPNYLFRSTNIVPGEFYSYTWELDVTEYTIRAGHRLALILYGSDPEYTYRPTVPTEFTVQIGQNTRLALPLIITHR